MAEIHATVTGKGKCVVLLHGFCEDHTLWHGTAEFLKSKYKIISIDLPGFGESSMLRKGFDLEDVAHAIHNFLAEKGYSHYSVLGHSLGGYVTLALAHLYPEAIKSIGLIHSTAMADAAEKKVNRNKAIAFIETHGSDLFLEQFVPTLFYPENRARLKQAMQDVTLMSRNITIGSIIGYMGAMRDRPDYTNQLLARVDSTLFIYGAHDELFSDADIAHQTNLIHNKQHVLCLENAAHMGMYEAPEELQIKIWEFLEQI